VSDLPRQNFYQESETGAVWNGLGNVLEWGVWMPAWNGASMGHHGSIFAFVGFL
jgi:hypothetical protein